MIEIRTSCRWTFSCFFLDIMDYNWSHQYSHMLIFSYFCWICMPIWSVSSNKLHYLIHGILFIRNQHVILWIFPFNIHLNSQSCLYNQLCFCSCSCFDQHHLFKCPSFVLLLFQWKAKLVCDCDKIHILPLSPFHIRSSIWDHSMKGLNSLWWKHSFICSWFLLWMVWTCQSRSRWV